MYLVWVVDVIIKSSNFPPSIRLTVLYLVKLYHPDPFHFLDEPAIHQEYQKKILGLGPDINKISRFIYFAPEGL